MSSNFVSNIMINGTSHPIKGKGETTYSSSSTIAISGQGVANALSGYATTSSLNVYQLIAQDMDTLEASGTIALADNTICKISVTGSITFTLPAISDITKLHQIMVQLYMSTAQTISVGTSYYFNKKAPDLTAAGVYNLYWEYDNTNGYWVCGCLSKGASV